MQIGRSNQQITIGKRDYARYPARLLSHLANVIPPRAQRRQQTLSDGRCSRRQGHETHRTALPITHRVKCKGSLREWLYACRHAQDGPCICTAPTDALRAASRVLTCAQPDLQRSLITSHVIPVQVLNRATDPFLPSVRPHTLAVLADLDSRGLWNHVLVIVTGDVEPAAAVTRQVISLANGVASVRPAQRVAFLLRSLRARSSAPYVSELADRAAGITPATWHE